MMEDNQLKQPEYNLMEDNQPKRGGPVISLPDAPDKLNNKFYALACCFLGSMMSIMLGYDIGVMSGASIFIERDLKINETQIQLLVGGINLYSLVGSAFAGKTSDFIGRKKTIVLAAVIFGSSAVLMGLAPNYWVLMLGRFIAGIGIGFAMMIAPVYTTELAPTSLRGFLTSFPEVFINFGVLFGYLANLAFKGLSLRLGWRVMLGVAAIPSFFLALMVLVMPESPRWLVMKGRLGDAKKVLLKTSDSLEDAQGRLMDIQEAAGIPLDCTDDVVQVKKVEKGKEVWKELFLHPSPAVVRILVAALGIHFFQQAVGIDSLVLYGPRIYEKAGVKSENGLFGASCGIGATKAFCILIATFLLDRFGRKPLLLISVGGMIVSCLFLATSLVFIDGHLDNTPTWAIATAIVTSLTYVGFFSAGLGPIAWVYSSEIWPLQLRAQGTAMAVAVNRGVSGIFGICFLSLSDALTMGGTYFLFAGICITAFLFFFLCLPETKGRNLEEVQYLFQQKRWFLGLKDKTPSDDCHARNGNGNTQNLV